MIDGRSPVIVGTGQLLLPPETPHDPGSPDLPVGMMCEAARRAVTDAGGQHVLRAVDSVRVVATRTCDYRDPAALVAAHLGLAGVQTVVATGGGESPSTLLGATAADLVAGRNDIALLVGGEAWFTRLRAERAGATLEQTTQPEGTEPDVVLAGRAAMSHPHELQLGIREPIQVYPLLEQALRSAAGRQVDEQIERFSACWSAMSAVASRNPYAWDPHRYSPEEIATVTPDNRMVGFPYTKLCSSNEKVDQAAAILVTSLDKARELGIAGDHCIFISAVAEGLSPTVSERFDLSTSPAATSAARALLAATGAGVDDIAYFDLYSCFPSAVQLQADALGIGLERALTVTGGMRFAGGPWRNYSMHAIAGTVEKLRQHGRPGALAIVSANGGYSTKISMGLYSNSPLLDGRSFQHLDAERDADEARRRDVDTNPSGSATVETYTVMHDRNSEPVEGILTCLMPDGRRAWGRVHEPSTLAGMVKEDVAGRQITLTPDQEGHIE